MKDAYHFTGGASMWYASLMDIHPIEPSLKEARSAVAHAKDVRQYHARNTAKGSKQREEDIEWALTRIKKAMLPLRKFLGQAPYKKQTPVFQDVWARVTEASNALQSERRKLWKMQKR